MVAARELEQARLHAGEIRFGTPSRRELETGGGLAREAREHTLPTKREVLKRRVQLHPLDLRGPLRERLRDTPKTLSETKRNPLPGEQLDGRHVGEAHGGAFRERPVPARLVPPLAPSEEDAGDVDRVDLKRSVKEPTRRRSLAETPEVAERNLARVDA